jgi:DNA-binding response OmpR family regulator
MARKVLIIEDNLDLQEIYKISFEEQWFIVELAEEWLKWIIKLLDNPPDIILLDIMMPGTDWFEVLRIIKKQSSIKTPIIVCSNLSSDTDRERVMTLWANDYIRKSDYEWDEIVEKVIQFLDNQPLEENL